jgi:uncharacterized protein YndB with AHSA1/START domain
MTDSAPSAEPVDGRVVVRRVIVARRERVFHNWTDPDQLRRWWGPGGFSCPEAVVDLRLGGTYRLVMQPDHGPTMSITGTYREIEPPARLVYTWRWDTGPAASDHESVVTVDFDDLGDGRTAVTVTHDRLPPDHDTSPYRSGWEEGLEKLDAAMNGRDGEVNA